MSSGDFKKGCKPWNAGINQESKICPVCEHEFFKNSVGNNYINERWAKRIACSKKCAGKLKRDNNRSKFKCEVCGGAVSGRLDSDRKYCSHKCYWKSKKGKPQPKPTGVIKFSDEARARMSIAQRNWIRPKDIGERISRAKKGKPRFDMRGANHKNWIHNRTELLERHRLRGGVKWREWREAVFSRDEHTCQECGVKGGYLEPHHIIPICKSMELLFTIKNGITLCRPCHLKTIRKEYLFEEKYSSVVAKRASLRQDICS